MAEKKELTQEEKDKKVAEEARKKSEARKKVIDDIVALLQKEFDKGMDQNGLQGIVREVELAVRGMQVVAAGAQHGPGPVKLEELRERLPVVAEPTQDGTPAANIAQASPDPEPKKATHKK